VSAQLSLLDAALAHADTGDDHQWLPGEDAMSDIQAVLSHIPGIGHAKGTSRERVYRPLACLYVRTALLDVDERKVAQAIARKCTGFTDPHNGLEQTLRIVRDADGEQQSVPVDVPIWVRLNGETPRMGREAIRPVRASDRDAVWWLEFRHGEHAYGKVKHWINCVRPGLRALGCSPKSKGHSIRLPSLAPLILALRWSDAIAAAVFLAGSGIPPRSGEWAMHVDLALSRGMPWAESLAVLSARHPRDVLSRALAWVHAQGMHRRVPR
jgi:hypothetical protein